MTWRDPLEQLVVLSMFILIRDFDRVVMLMNWIYLLLRSRRSSKLERYVLLDRLID